MCAADLNSNTTPVEIFVSPQGNDAWSGKLPEPGENDGPFATINRARLVVRELRKTETVPVRVILRGGIYFQEQPLEFWPADSGTKEAPITYAAAPGEKVILSGGRRLTGGEWGEVNGRKVWVFDLPEVKIGKWKFRQLFVNGERRLRPRLPKAGLYQIEALPGIDVTRGSWDVLFEGTDRFIYSDTNIQPWHNLFDVEVIGVTRWITNRLPIQEVNTEQRLVTFDRKSLFTLNNENATPSVYWVENVLEALDTPGEWYLERLAGKLYYLPRPGEEVPALEIIAPRLETVVRLVGWEGFPVEYLNFEGLTISHNEWEPPKNWASSLQAASEVPGAIYCDYAEWCAFRGGGIEHTGTYGVEINMGCLEIEISHNRMVDLGAGGVRIGHFFDHEPTERGERRTAQLPKGPPSQRISITDNEVNEGGKLFAGSAGIFVGENPGNKILHNHIHHLPWLGIQVGSLHILDAISPAIGNVIEYNYVHHLGDGVLSDIGGIYTNSVSPGTRIRYNVVHDILHRDYGGWGIYTDESSSDLLIEKNLVYRCSSGPLFPHQNHNLTIVNNIFAFGREYQVRCGYEMDRLQFVLRHNIIFYTDGAAIADYCDLENLRFDHNLYWNTSGKPVLFDNKNFEEWQAVGQDVHSLVADPLFVDAEHGDFRLKAGSPAEKIGFDPWDLSEVGPRPIPTITW